MGSMAGLPPPLSIRQCTSPYLAKCFDVKYKRVMPNEFYRKFSRESASERIFKIR